MTDHGELEQAEADQVIGALVRRAVDQMKFAPGAHAKVAFSIDGAAYEITVKAKPA